MRMRTIARVASMPWITAIGTANAQIPFSGQMHDGGANGEYVQSAHIGDSSTCVDQAFRGTFHTSIVSAKPTSPPARAVTTLPFRQLSS